MTTTSTRVAVTDPFPARLDIAVVPAWNAATVRTVLVDLDYDDPANTYHRDLRLEFTGSDQAVRNVHIAIHDPARRSSAPIHGRADGRPGEADRLRRHH